MITDKETFFVYSGNSLSAESRIGVLTLGGTLAKSTLISSKRVKHWLLVNTTADFICQGLQPLSVSLANQPPPVSGRPFICDIMHAFKCLQETAELRFRLPHHMYVFHRHSNTSKVLLN